DHVGGDIAGTNGVDRDSLARVFPREGFCEAYVARFRGSVIGLAYLALLTVDGGDIDDPAEAAHAHPLDHRAGHVEKRIQIDVDDLVPLLQRHVVEHGVAGDPRIIDEDIDRPDFVTDFSEPFGAGLVVRHIPFVDRDSRLRLEFRRRFVVARIVRGDRVTRRLQSLADGGPNPARTAADHRYPSHEFYPFGF